MFIGTDDEEEVFDYLKGIRYRNETENGIMQYASMAGGMEIFIDGAGFDFLANLNTVLFTSDTTECLTMAGTALDRKFTLFKAESDAYFKCRHLWLKIVELI